MAYGRRSTASSISEAFTDLSPLPYPVLLILGVIFIFLGTSWYFSLEDFVESTEEQLGWILLAAPLVLLVLVRWLPTSMEDSAGFFATSPWTGGAECIASPPREAHRGGRRFDCFAACFDAIPVCLPRKLV